jgi:hypothetical protein
MRWIRYGRRVTIRSRRTRWRERLRLDSGIFSGFFFVAADTGRDGDDLRYMLITFLFSMWYGYVSDD